MSRVVRRLAAIALTLGLAQPALAQTTVRYVHTDSLGSVVAMTDENRVVVERREYEPYGQQLTALEDGPGFTGHVQDAASGLTYMQQRYYDPGIGLFLSADPVTADPSNGGLFNRFHYADNNPYMYVDPDGRQAFCGNSRICPPTEQETPEDPPPPEGDGTEGDESAGSGETTPSEVDPVADYLDRRNKMFVEATDTLNDAAEYAAKEGAIMIATGPFGRAGIALGVGRVAALSKAGSKMDRNGLTRAGRALQKHSTRSNSAFRGSAPIPHSQLNQRGQQTLDDILTSSSGIGSPNRFGGSDFRAPDGRGARFDGAGNFMGFLEP